MDSIKNVHSWPERRLKLKHAFEWAWNVGGLRFSISFLYMKYMRCFGTAYKSFSNGSKNDENFFLWIAPQFQKIFLEICSPEFSRNLYPHFYLHQKIDTKKILQSENIVLSKSLKFRFHIYETERNPSMEKTIYILRCFYRGFSQWTNFEWKFYWITFVETSKNFLSIFLIGGWKKSFMKIQ